MQVTRIIAIRHGETAWNVDTRIQGHLDIELSDVGREQARLAGLALQEEGISAIYSSDLKRAFETAQAIANASELGHVEPWPGLRERHFGHFQGKTWAEIEAEWPQDAKLWRTRDPHWAPEGGESLTLVRQRIDRNINEIAAQHIGQAIVLVAHGGVMDTIYRLATKQEIQTPRTWYLGNAAINRLLWTPEQGLSLVGWGDVSHLQGSLDESSS
jgi:2,3-bisphosphoglycerate-dependent phosphoglycerate mutase